MNYLIQLSTVIFAGVSVAVADMLIKKVSIGVKFIQAIKDPWLFAVLLLYLIQIPLFIFVFTRQWNLAIVGNLQMIFYSLSVVLLGLLIFGESISPVQYVGIALAIIGVFLLNF